MQKNREIRGIRKKQLAKLVWLVRVLFHFLCLLSHWLPEALGQSRCIPTRSRIRSSGTPGFVDQGGRGLVGPMEAGVARGADRQVDGPPWVVHIAGAGPAFRSVGISVAHIGFQGRRGHRWRHQMGVPQPPKRKNLHISPFLPHTLPLRRGRIQNSQSSSMMLS